MNVLKLIYVEKGLEVICPISEFSDIEKIKKEWKFRYGKLYDKCDIVHEGQKLKGPKKRRVRNISTDEIYESIKEASIALFMSENGVRNQCMKFYKRVKSDFKYIVEYV